MQVAEYTSAAEMRAAYRARKLRMAKAREFCVSPPNPAHQPVRWRYIHTSPIGPDCPMLPVSAGSTKSLPRVTLRQIMAAVSDVSGISTNQLLSKSRGRSDASVRHIMNWIARTYSKFSLWQIATAYNRDHSTIMYGIRKVAANRARYEPLLSDCLKKLRLK